MRWISAILLACMLSNTFPAQAESSAKDLLQLHQSGIDDMRRQVEQTVSIFENGMAWANVELIQKRKTRALYCANPRMGLTGPQLIDMIARFVGTNPHMAEFPYGMVLLRALQDLFPCPPQSN